MMIVFSMLIISNVFQKPIFIIIIISMHYDQMKNFSFILEFFFQHVHIFLKKIDLKIFDQKWITKKWTLMN
jgi:hypothetical protein